VLSAWRGCDGRQGEGAGIFAVIQDTDLQETRLYFLLMEKHVPFVCFIVQTWRGMLEDTCSFAGHTQYQSTCKGSWYSG